MSKDKDEPCRLGKRVPLWVETITISTPRYWQRYHWWMNSGLSCCLVGWRRGSVTLPSDQSITGLASLSHGNLRIMFSLPMFQDHEFSLLFPVSYSKSEFHFVAYYSTLIGCPIHVASSDQFFQSNHGKMMFLDQVLVNEISCGTRVHKGEGVDDFCSLKCKARNGNSYWVSVRVRYKYRSFSQGRSRHWYLSSI